MPNLTVVRCPRCATRYPEDEDAFSVRIISNSTTEHPDDTTHTLRLECCDCSYEMEFQVNLLPEFSTGEASFPQATPDDLLYEP